MASFPTAIEIRGRDHRQSKLNTACLRFRTRNEIEMKVNGGYIKEKDSLSKI